jgi:hypothetical protein
MRIIVSFSDYYPHCYKFNGRYFEETPFDRLMIACISVLNNLIV